MKDEYSDEEYMQEQTQKAREEEVLLMAKNMKEAEVAIKTIASVTGLSMEQIESL